MARSIADAVGESGESVADDDLVNFGSRARAKVNPVHVPRSYWFRYGDIKDFTLKHVQGAIGDLASAGEPGGADVMRVSELPATRFTPRPPANLYNVEEFAIDAPVLVRCNVEVGK